LLDDLLGPFYTLHRCHHHDPGDDQGLVLPPKLAPIQVVVVPIYKNDTEKSAVLPWLKRYGKLCKDCGESGRPQRGLSRIQVQRLGIARRARAPGSRAKGRGKEFGDGARRDIPGRDGKTIFTFEQLKVSVTDLLEEIHKNMYQRACDFRDAHIFDPGDYEELKKTMEKGWALSWWCGDPALKPESKKTPKPPHAASARPARRFGQVHRVRRRSHPQGVFCQILLASQPCRPLSLAA
jgi:prolyl-tRNA synthetase